MAPALRLTEVYVEADEVIGLLGDVDWVDDGVTLRKNPNIMMKQISRDIPASYTALCFLH